MTDLTRADPHIYHPNLAGYVEAGATLIRVIAVESLDAYPQILLALSGVPDIGDIITIDETSVAPALEGEVVYLQKAESYLSRAQDAADQNKYFIYDVTLRPLD